MAASSIPSDVAATAALVVISALVLLVLRQYLPLRITPSHLLVPVFLALALPSSIILLVPIDLASSAGTDDGTRGIWLPEGVMVVAWRITYWLTFALTWYFPMVYSDTCTDADVFVAGSYYPFWASTWIPATENPETASHTP